MCLSWKQFLSCTRATFFAAIRELVLKQAAKVMDLPGDDVEKI
jgi:hypothetical protein